MNRRLFRIWSDKQAAVAPTVALSLFALIGVGGIAFDYAHMAGLDTELQNAADQAALAAASQLDGESAACSRAVAAARLLVTNQTVMANDSGGLAVTIADSNVCTSDTVITDNPDASIRFFQDKLATVPATTMADANFVQVAVDTRRANYALTPVVGALSSGDMRAQAVAGLGTAICKVPPLMICPPTGGVSDWNALRGHGIRAVSNSGPNWAPGDFGYIGPQDANSTQIGLAFQNPVFQCQQIEGPQSVSSGAPTPAIVAINTRFDIYDISNGAGVALAPCLGSACPPALNVTKDLVKTSGSGCGTRTSHNNGNDAWHLVPAANRFRPVQAAGADPMRQFQTAGQTIQAMGLPRDNCHYTSYGSTCPGANPRFGDGVWARGDYWAKNHAGVTPPADAATWTRYETYLWEITNNSIPNDTTGTDRQRGSPVCNATVPDPSRDRRVLQVAVGGNCGSLHGASTPVQIGAWVDMFLVEPGVANPGRGNGDSGNEIYLEVIGEVTPGGNAAQIIRRDSPYLVR
ncbi:pilus assembly protein TadG-related protein [Sphingomonas sp. RB56-2]|uniref:Pilus assembly protein TadG-related protein n=1 Tax=Sphingomonas brevis TaxID=2908206 RepID=A0ABT0SBH1_9SPHN|nr:pilus assembly protein TadG-related protein [Sphingomonas brevis]MCL6741411.1 pilus assembly protein TadG-related protein [Sphingomonas brevis]